MRMERDPKVDPQPFDRFEMPGCEVIVYGLQTFFFPTVREYVETVIRERRDGAVLETKWKPSLSDFRSQIAPAKVLPC